MPLATATPTLAKLSWLIVETKLVRFLVLPESVLALAKLFLALVCVKASLIQPTSALA